MNITTVMYKTTATPPTVRPANESENEGYEESFEVSSYVNSPTIFWPARRKMNPRIFTPPIPRSTTSRPLLKLLQPKPTRPPLYRLDGFVPEPSVRHLTTTEVPSHIRKLYKSRYLQLLLSKRGHERCSDSTKNGLNPWDVMLVNKNPINKFTAYGKIGEPGKDFPVYNRIPVTTFVCGDIRGSFADPDTGCQVWHLCPGNHNEFRYSFLCPNGTIFNERRGICDWWYNVVCTSVRCR
ncbi:uncharacterized protein LOC143232410 [Tachypleus tridentatus]|uniref:uncharacterized protein LOC143232410 n=1 Tax=Tachypleus tridentatus TaxID=6853 RepID=UPI003FD10AC3